MNIKQMVDSAVISGKDTSGQGYYKVYICDDVVVKRYDNENFFAYYQHDLQTHKDLDKHNLIPKMIGHYESDDYSYLIVERVLPLCMQNAYSMDIDNMRDKYSEDVFDLGIECLNHGYDLSDRCSFNFGHDKDGNFVCLDEGCFTCNISN